MIIQFPTKPPESFDEADPPRAVDGPFLRLADLNAERWTYSRHTLGDAPIVGWQWVDASAQQVLAQVLPNTDAGSCSVCPAALAQGARGPKSAVHADFVILNISNGYSQAGVIGAVRRENLLGSVHCGVGHNSIQSLFKTAEVAAWLHEPPSVAGLQKYLEEAQFTHVKVHD